MEIEDSRNALFCDPNAYIQQFKPENTEVKKVVFQEPYEALPNFYIDNNFSKHNCDCVKNKKSEFSFNNFSNNGCYNYGRSYDMHNKQNKKFDCSMNNNTNHNCNHSLENRQSKGFNFDLKSLMPLLGIFNKGGGTDLSNIVGLLSNKNNFQDGNSSNLISSILSNNNMISGLLNMFKGGLNKSKPTKKQIKTTDFEIKNYTRVE